MAATCMHPAFCRKMFGSWAWRSWTSGPRLWGLLRDGSEDGVADGGSSAAGVPANKAYHRYGIVK